MVSKKVSKRKPLPWRLTELKRAVGAFDAAGKRLKGVRLNRDGSFEFELIVDNPKPWSDSDDAVSITEAELKDLI